MPAPSKLRSSLYAGIAGLGLAGISYWLGTIHGSERALAQFRDLSFQTNEASLARLLRLDSMLAADKSDDARRTVTSVAWSQYASLEDDAGGVYLPPSLKMRDSIAAIRKTVASYCHSGFATRQAAAAPNVCTELAQRTK